MTYFDILITFIIRWAPAWIPILGVLIAAAIFERKAFKDEK